MTEPWPPLSDTPESNLASISPRTALLSPPYENAELTRPQRVSRGPNDKFRNKRERVHSTASHRDLVHSLVNEEYESKQTRKVLYTALDRLDAESRRAEESEFQLAETLERTRAINEARVAAQQEAARAQEELRLYKLQLQNAQREILRAQEILAVIEAQRDDAETSAAQARAKARKLNEERLIEIAREEGRRLGYEEGIRRGRNMGYKDGRSQMREVATCSLERSLSAQEGEEAFVIPPPTVEPMAAPIPASQSAPEVLRVPSVPSLNGRRDSRPRRDSESDSTRRISGHRAPDPIIMPVMVEHPNPVLINQTIPSQSHQQPQPWSMPNRSSARSPPTRPPSVRNSAPSVHHPDFRVPPEGFIPTLDKDQRISLPPPHELHRNMSSPSPSQPITRASSDSLRTYEYPLRRTSPESQASTKISQSQSSSISALEIVGLPNVPQRDKRRERNNLSVIHEDPSFATEYETMTGSDAGHHHYRSERRSERDNDSEASRHLRRERDQSNQRLADQLRWSDPSEAEEWRRYGAEKASIHSSRGGPTRPHPENVTMPSPLSSPNWNGAETPVPLRRHHRQSRSVSTPSDRGSVDYEHRRVVSSDSSVPEITIQPPSNPPSDAPSRRVSVSGLLSPDHANLPLPVPAPGSQRTPLVYTVPNTPVSAPPSLMGSIYDASPTVFFPAGSGGPVIPNHGNGRETPSQHHNNNTNSLYASSQSATIAEPKRSKSKSKSKSSSSSNSKQSQSPHPPSQSQSQSRPYVASPVPSGLRYPAPPISRESTPNNGTGERSRRESLSQTAGMTPAARTRGLHGQGGTAVPGPGTGPGTRPGGGGGGGSHDYRSSEGSKTHSHGRGSRQSYTHYDDPGVYKEHNNENDPAYLSSNESFLDPRTCANTAANAGGGGGASRTRSRTSSRAYE